MQLDPLTVQKGTTLGGDATTIVWQHPRGSHSGCRQAKSIGVHSSRGLRGRKHAQNL